VAAGKVTWSVRRHQGWYDDWGGLDDVEPWLAGLYRTDDSSDDDSWGEQVKKGEAHLDDAGHLVLELAAGLALALLLAARFPGRQLVRAIVVLPFALPEIVFLTIMRYVLAPRGYANAALGAAGLGPIDWLAPGQWLTLATIVARLTAT